jgi:DNA-binding XRE family transcriptional regulator
MPSLNQRYANMNRPVKITVMLPVQTLVRLEGLARDLGLSRRQAVEQAVGDWTVRREQSSNRQDRLAIQQALKEAMDKQPVEELLERFRKQMGSAPARVVDGPRNISPNPLTAVPGSASLSAMVPVPTIRTRREALGMTRQELANLAKCSMTMLQTLENGYIAQNSGVEDRAEEVLTQAEQEAKVA